MKNLDPKTVAGMIDNTNLKPFITNDDWDELCQISSKYGFKTVAINNAGIAHCSDRLKGTNVLVDAAVSFPLGQCTIETKCFETEDAIEKGAGEVDYVINVSELKNKNFDYIKKEMECIVSICRDARIVSKVIFETCYLTDEEIIKLCEIANEVRPDFIKTSTGFGTHGAKVEHIKLMREHASPSIQIKASGGIRSLADFAAMVDAGATRIGTSVGVTIVDELTKIKNDSEA